VRQYYEAKIASNEDRFEAFAADQSLGTLRNAADRTQVPGPVREACDFYCRNVLEQDWGNVRVFRISVQGELTFAVRVISDGGDGWLEVFDGRGGLLGTARTDCGLVLWRPQEEIRRRVSEGLPLEAEFLAARERRAQGQ
jgi:hypothetical protein